MSNLEYFNCRSEESPEFERQSGQTVSIDEINLLMSKEDGLAVDPNIDPLFRAKTDRWEKSVASMIYAISGQIPTREEVKIGRRIIEFLPKDFKKEFVDIKFVLGYLPFLLVLAKGSASKYQEDANNIADMAEFVTKTFEQESVDITSLLCAHRAGKDAGVGVLTPTIPPKKVRKIARAFQGLFFNSKSEKMSITWYQQFATELSSSNMFPAMFLGYFDSGRVPDMLLLIEKHRLQMKMILDEISSERSVFRLDNLDLVSNSTFNLLDIVGDWESISSAGPNSSHNIEEKLALLFDESLKDLQRFSRYYDLDPPQSSQTTAKNIERAKKLMAIESIPFDLVELTQLTIDWYLEKSRMPISAKALFELYLSYTWGKMNAENSAIGIGIDRDHSNQRILAYNEGQKVVNPDIAIPLIYARRTKKENPKNSLAMYSLRQFWRD